MISSDKSFDVAIAGAGPAGTSLAIRLAKRGLKVLIVDKSKLPRDKLCGEFISTECNAHFAELGVDSLITDAGAVPIERTVFYSRTGNFLTVPSGWFGKRQSAVGLSRAAMDFALLRRAGDLGVTIREAARVTELIWDKHEIAGFFMKNIDGEVASVRARLVLDATGRANALGRMAFKGKTRQIKADQIAFKVHVKGAQIPVSDCEIYVYRGGYGGCGQIEDGIQNLCFIVSAEVTKSLDSDPHRVLREVVFENARARESLRRIEFASPWLAVPIASFGRSELSPADGLITVGDSAAFIDPFTGSGILMAFENSKIAADVIVDFLKKGDESFSTLISKYRHKYGDAFARRLRVASALRYASNAPFAADCLISVLSKSSALTQFVARSTRV